MKGESGVEFLKFSKMGESHFSHKNRGVSKIGEVVLKKRGDITYFHIN